MTKGTSVWESSEDRLRGHTVSASWRFFGPFTLQAVVTSRVGGRADAEWEILDANTGDQIYEERVDHRGKPPSMPELRQLALRGALAWLEAMAAPLRDELTEESDIKTTSGARGKVFTPKPLKRKDTFG